MLGDKRFEMSNDDQRKTPADSIGGGISSDVLASIPVPTAIGERGSQEMGDVFSDDKSLSVEVRLE